LREDWLLVAEATKVEDWVASCDAAVESDTEFIREAYRQALSRDVEGDELQSAVRPLTLGVSRKLVLKSIYGSPERLFRVAERNGL
jgi:hypothetical protein